jgi:hypothetical protein
MRIKKEYHQAQTWLNFNYPKEERSNFKEIVINGN